MATEDIVVFEEKDDDEGGITHQGESRKARSWDGVVSERLEEWNTAGLGTLESLSTRTKVRIKWLDSASQ